MGGGGSKGDGAKDGGEDEKPGHVHRLLLLGAGEAGKSTIFKCIKMIKREGYDQDEKIQFGLKMQTTIIKTLKMLNGQNVASGPDVDAIMALPTPEDKTTISVNGSILNSAKAMWALQEIKDQFEKSKGEFDNSTIYLFSKLDEIQVPMYEATADDILRYRSPTTEFSEVDYTVKNTTLRFVDVGGQRKERLKWGTVGKVTAIIFVVALDEYDKTLVEDVTRNRMKESLLLFRMITTKYFQGVPVIFFMNKRDLFEEKIKRVDLNSCFADYSGGCDYDNALAHIENAFVANADKSEVHPHVTCATDTGQMEHTLGALENIVFAQNIGANF